MGGDFSFYIFFFALSKFLFTKIRRLTMRLITIMLLLLLLLGVTGPASALTLSDWNVLETDHFLIFYQDDYERHALETLYYLERYRPLIESLTGNTIEKQSTVVVQDLGMLENAYASPIENKMGIFVGNPSTFSTLDSSENWLRTLAVHEYTHIKQLTYASGASDLLTTLFGNIFSPNLFIPNWMAEGIAIYAESVITPYEGRLNDGYYDALIAAKASEGRFPSIQESDYNHNTFPGGLWYLSGAAFFEYLSNTYGEERFGEYFTTYSSYWWTPFLLFSGEILPFLTYDRAAKEVYGKSFTELYDEWQEYEEKRHKDWRIDGEQLVSTERGSIRSLTPYEGKLYYFSSDILSTAPFSYRRVTSLKEYDPQRDQERTLISFTPSGSPHTRFQIADGKIYYALQEIEEGYANTDQLGYGVEAILYSYSMDTGEVEELFLDRVKAFTVLHDGTIIYAVDSIKSFGSEIWQYANGQKEKLGSLPELVSEFILHGDRLLLVSKGGWSNNNLNYLSLEDLSLESITDTPWTEMNPMIDHDSLIYAANYNREYAIYNYNLHSKELTKLTEGGFSIQPALIDDSLYFVGLTAEGEGIFVKDYTPVEVAMPESTLSIEDEYSKILEEAQPKDAFSENLQSMIIPHMRLIPDLAMGSDALGMNHYYISWFGTLSLSSSMFQPLVLQANLNPFGGFYALGGSYPLLQSSQKGLSQISLSANIDDTVA